MYRYLLTNILTRLVFTTLLFAALTFSSYAFAQNAATLAECEKFKIDAAKEALVEIGALEVPADHFASATTKPGPTLSIFYWIRRGTDSTKPPVLLIHGGPGGNSWRYYATFKTSTYTGDIVSIDNRNEGCSHSMAYDKNPSDYRIFRSRQIVEDLELLRAKLYPGSAGSSRLTQWRVFGQSRGVTIAHHYLEMYPDSLESVQTHGFAALPANRIPEYTFMRSQWNARGSERFEAAFPEAATVLREAQSYFEKNKICLPMNFGKMNLPLATQPLACGAKITDSISYKLSNYAKWSVISQDLLGLRMVNGELDTAKLGPAFTKELNGNIYVGHMNYIMGTNGQDVASPSPESFPMIRSDLALSKALISEGRFVADIVYPAYLKSGYPLWTSGGDAFDFDKVRANLEKYKTAYGRPFSFVLFSSIFDTIAGPEMYQDEKALLGDLVEVRSLTNSGHEGWSTEPAVQQHLFR